MVVYFILLFCSFFSLIFFFPTGLITIDDLFPDALVVK